MKITPTSQNPITSHDTTIIQQHQNDDQHDPFHDHHFTAQPKQERQPTPVHQDPMVYSARPDGHAVKIHTLRVVDLAPVVDRAVVAPC
jgi:hypothetical protein